MATSTYKYIAKSELTTTASSVTFNSLGSYKDLVIHYSARGDTADWASQVRIYFNGSTSNRQSNMTRGISSAAQISQYTLTDGGIGYCAAGNATSGSFGTGWIYIPDYQSTSFDKIAYGDSSMFGVLTNGDAISTSIAFIQNPNTAAITSITLTQDVGNFVAYSSFWLFGID